MMSDNPVPKQSTPFQKPEKHGFKMYLLVATGFVFGFLLIFILSILTLRWVNPPFTAFTLQEDWEELEIVRYSLRDYWTPENKIPDHLKWAVIASEDQRFWEHGGFDWEAIDEALEENRGGERQRGASTITQQVAKNLFLTPAQSFFRKGIEACITLLIELFWPKDRILEVYLNTAEFGPGLFGIGRATPELFGSAPHEIEPEESARMAVVLPSPKRIRIEPPSPYTKKRSQWILRQMTQLTGISYVRQAVIDTTAVEDEVDPLLRDFDTDSEFMDEADSVGVEEEGPLPWDEIPDSILYFNNP